MVEPAVTAPEPIAEPAPVVDTAKEDAEPAPAPEPAKDVEPVPEPVPESKPEEAAAAEPAQEEAAKEVEPEKEAELPRISLDDAQSMKVAELREELEKRGLSSKGTKPVLVDRLTEA